MFKKIALVAAFAAVAVSGQSVNATANITNTSVNASVVTNSSALPAAGSTPYGRELFSKLLEELQIEHIANQPLSDEEYNGVVNDLEKLLTGEYKAVTKKEKKQLRKHVKEILARMTPEEMEQLFSDVTFELTVKFFESTFSDVSLDEFGSNSTANATSNDIIIGAAQQKTFSGLTRGDIVTIGTAFGGCVLSVAVALAVIGARAQKKKAAEASTKSVLADNVIDEIADAENLAAEEKDAEVEDVKNDSPAVVSV